MPDITVKGRKYSSQMKEYVEYDSNKVRYPRLVHPAVNVNTSPSL